jgi:hypothetical protein
MWKGSGAGVALGLALVAGAPALAQERKLKAHTEGVAVFLGAGMATSDSKTGPTGRVSVHYRFADNFAVGPALTLAQVEKASDLFPPGPEAQFGAVGLDFQARTHVDRTSGWASLSPFLGRFRADDLDTDAADAPGGFEYVRSSGTRFGVELGVGVDLQVAHWLALSASGRAMVRPLGPSVEGAASGEEQKARSAFLFHLGPTFTF